MWNLNGSYLPQGTWDQRCSRANLGEVTNLGACANNMCSFGPKMSGMGSLGRCLFRPPFAFPGL